MSVLQVNNARTFIINKNQISSGIEHRRPGHPMIDEEMDFVSADYRGKARTAIQRYKSYATSGFVSNDGNAIDVRRITPGTTAKVTETGAKVFYHAPYAGQIDVSL